MDTPEGRFIAFCITLVPAPSFAFSLICIPDIHEIARVGRCSTIPREMLGTGQHRFRVGNPIALQPPDRSSPELGNQLVVFGKPFVSPAPAFILWHGNARGKGPVDPGCPHFLCGNPANLLNQLRIARAAQANVVGKDHGTEYIVVPVNGVDPIDQGNAESGLGGLLLTAFVKPRPRFHGVVISRIGTTATQDGAQKVGLDILRIFQPCAVGLDHLAYFLVKCHLREQVFGLRVILRKPRGTALA
jgi:hypothetical protein